jgi:hypothetical protein
MVLGRTRFAGRALQSQLNHLRGVFHLFALAAPAAAALRRLRARQIKSHLYTILTVPLRDAAPADSHTPNASFQAHFL